METVSRQARILLVDNDADSINWSLELKLLV